nr:MAG TPA: hypothetical protein [Caudoviricetes sp.]
MKQFLNFELHHLSCYTSCKKYYSPKLLDFNKSPKSIDKTLDNP